MTNLSRTLCLAVLGSFLSGCASHDMKQAGCALAGALVGGAAGYYGTDHSEGAAAASAAAGAALGAVLCQEKEMPAPEPKPAPKPQPKPKPAPKPAPPADTDGDGVIDSLDKCPGTPKGTPVDAHGCPEIPNLTGVHFEHDKASLTADARSQLDQVANTLKANPHVRVEVVGHTDSSGSAEYNQGLSQRRAASVGAYLQSQGITADRINTSGMGEGSPIASNDTKAGRAENRRVELTAKQLN